MPEFTGDNAGSKRADQEMALESHPWSSRGLAFVNGGIAIVGIVVLALAGLMISEESATTAAVTPLLVCGVGLSVMGTFGIFAARASADIGKENSRRILGAYWLALFFGTVLAVWMCAYAAANFSKIEHKVMVHFEENWAELVVDLPEELLDKVPQSCGGNKVNQCDFSVEGAATPGFADATAPTDAEAEACEAVEFEPTEGEDDLICVYAPPCSLPAACVGKYDDDGDGEDNADCEPALAPPSCAGTVTSTNEDCAELDEFLCNMVADNCPEDDGCVFDPGTVDDPLTGEDEAEDACTGASTSCEYFAPEAGEAMCLEVTVESDDEDDEGRRLEETEPEPEPFVLGSSEDFEAQCWNTIKDSMMENTKSVTVALGVVVVLMLLCMFWCIQLLTLGSAISSVKKAIDFGMTVAGGLLFITGIVMMGELSDDTMYLTAPFLVLGGLMLCLGILFGCFSKDYPTCAKYASLVYVFLFIVMVVMAFMCIAYEDTVRETVAEKGDVWLEKFCNAECYADIQAKMNGTRSADAMCNTPPEGTGECYDAYEWAADKHLDIACNSTAPNTISQLCACPCRIAKAAADVKSATEEFIITKVMSSLNTMGWMCILVSMYLFIEVLAHVYNFSVARVGDVDKEAADQPRGI